MCLCTGSRQPFRTLLASGESGDLMPGSNQLRCDRRADKSGRSRKKNTHS